MSTFMPSNTTPGETSKLSVNQVATTASIYPVPAGATLLRVCAIAKDILIRWGHVDTEYCTAIDFDDVVAVGTTQDIAIPGTAKFISFLSQASGGSVVAVVK